MDFRHYDDPVRAGKIVLGYAGKAKFSGDIAFAVRDAIESNSTCDDLDLALDSFLSDLGDDPFSSPCEVPEGYQPVAESDEDSGR